MKIEGISGAVMTLEEEKNAEMPEKVTVLVFPGGGYSWLSERESLPVERALHGAGFRAAILYYDTDSEVLGLTPLRQAAWGVAKLRELYPGDPVYVLGFSAGSHCAGSLAVHWNHRDWKGEELFREVREFLGRPELPAETFRPDRAILSYPVITSGTYAHFSSFERLTGIPEEEIRISAVPAKALGPEKTAELDWFSLELQADEDMPPVFLWHTASDESVPVQNSLLLAARLTKCGVPVELHVYPRGPHGLSLATKEVEQPEKDRMADPHVAQWFESMVRWMRYPV